MKIFHLIALLFFVSNLSAQSSYYFSEVLPSSTHKVLQVDEKWFGTYTKEGASYSYELSAEGISVISVQISSVSKEFIRESSTYDVKDGFIFGVVANDSLPCILEKGRYYFGIRNKEVVIGISSNHVLTKIDNTHYMINYSENGNYLPTMLEFGASGLTIREFEYDPNSSTFPFISEQAKLKIANQQLTILSPTVQEFQQLNTALHFKNQDSFIKQKLE